MSTDEKFPLTKALGVDVLECGVHSYGGCAHAVRASDLERTLEQAPVITGLKAGPQEENLSWWQNTDAKLCAHTHTARLLCVQPIVRDTAESLLREIISRWKRGGNEMFMPSDDIIDRANALLAKGEKE